jgi:cell wall-associated NlpC family hydrolase
LLRLVYRDALAIELPAYGEDYANACDDESIVEVFNRERSEWFEVDAPAPLDAVMFRIFALPLHVGVVVDAGLFLHVMDKRGTCIERLSSPAWANRVLSFYRHRSMFSTTRVLCARETVASSSSPMI